MNGLVTLRLAAGLADATGRDAAGALLAQHLGGVALFILIEDPEVGAFVPAPGFPQTLPGGATWRALLSAPPSSGIHRYDLGYPTADQVVPTCVYAAPGILLIVVGDCDPEAVEALGTVAPLLAAMISAEQSALAARGELAVARSQARQAAALAQALDAARSENERSVRELEAQAQELHAARSRAESGARAKDEFLAMLGHELRNPLSPILTALQLMRLKNLSSREQDIIERQVGSLMRLVDDLLDISRITSGKIELRTARVELAEVAARAIEMASPSLEKKRQRLVIDIPTVGCVVTADSSRLAQVLANLLTNASKYSDAGTDIVFAAGDDEQGIRISVRDQGIGIVPSRLNVVFEMFVQNRQSLDRAQGGLGLGLAIVKSLVTLHGGTVSAHSEGEGLGSEFVVRLPRAKGIPDVAPAPRRTASVDGLQQTRHAPGRVLVVDDNEDAKILMSEALDALGYEVRTAPDGPAALRIAVEFLPDIAVLDIGLPVMDGYELARRLRATPRLDTLRLVAVTGYGQQEDARRSRDAGFEAHLVKPVALAQLTHVFDDLHRGGTAPHPNR